MYCYYNVLPEAIFVVYIKKNFGGPTCDEYLSSCKISRSVVLWFWQNCHTALRETGREREDKEHEKTSFAVFPGCYVEIHLFLVNLFFFVCFRH